MNVIDLSIGHPKYGSPKEAKAGGARWLMQEEVPGYPNPQGSLALRRKLVEKLALKNNILTTVDQVVITSGGTGGILAAMASVLEPGDSILVPDPGFPHYRLMCEMLAVKMIPYPLRKDCGYLPNLEQLESLREERTKVILLNSPGNPIGQVFPKETLMEIGSWLERTDLYCISDEVYEDLYFAGIHDSAVKFGNPDRYFSVYSFSKSYGMADMRIGYVVCPLQVAEKVTRFVWTTSMGVNSLAQSAALTVLQTQEDYHLQMVGRLRKTRDRVADLLLQTENEFYLPQAAFYFWINIGNTGFTSEEFSERFSQSYQVLVTPGSSFGRSGQFYIRISFAEEEDVVLEAMQRFRQVIHQIRKGAQL